MRRLTELPEVREGLFLASPSFEERLLQWREAYDTEHDFKVERTLVRYLARMSARSTPFGLFAGTSVGTLGETSRLRLGARRDYRRHTRLDMEYLFSLAESLQESSKLRSAMRYRPNTSLYEVAGRIRYTEARVNRESRSYHLVEVEPTSYLRATLMRSERGATIRDLANALCEDDAEIAFTEAEGYVHELIVHQILRSELQPPITGEEATGVLVRELRGTEALEEIGLGLGQAQAEIAEFDRAGLGLPPLRYRRIARELERLPPKVELSRLFQIDLVKSGPALSLGRGVADAIQHSIILLGRLTSAREDPLRNFKTAFDARYGRREVPLVEVLDEENGIGFDSPGQDGAPLLADIAFPSPPRTQQSGWSTRDRLLARHLTGAIARGDTELVFGEDELAPVLGTVEDAVRALPDSFACVVTLAARSATAIDDGQFRLFLEGAYGPSGARMLGRFAHSDLQLAAQVHSLLRDEAALDPDAIFAEVVHLPEGRFGNILQRPLLREHEIVFLGRSGADPSCQLHLHDLTLSLVDDELILRSRRLDKRVIPRLTSAHNYSLRSHAAYRFLCAMQLTTGVAFSWGALDQMPYLPRLVIGNVVLSLRTWRVDSDRLAALGRERGAARYASVQALRRERGMPRLVAIKDDDKVLPVDLDNAVGVDAFVHYVKNREEVKLTEVYPGPGGLCLSGPEGDFCHEIVMPFTKTRPPTPSRVVSPVASKIRRSLLPGSDWLYFKLYTGPATLDRALSQLADTIRELRRSGIVDRWFFVRYGDPDWHLRLRLHGDPERLGQSALPAVGRQAEALHAAGLIWRLMLDTYEPEVERYGGPAALEFVEQVFEADSTAVVSILETLQGDAGLETRWRLCLRGIDQLLDDLSIGFHDKVALISTCRTALGRELGIDRNVDRALGARFRRERPLLEALLDRRGPQASAHVPGLLALADRSEKIRRIAPELLQALNGARGLQEVACSLIHMHCNRVLRAAARQQELVLYDFLSRLYESEAKRK